MVSISSERRDAVIEKVLLKVKHEKGEERQLTWKFLDETFSQIRTQTGESAEYSKNQPAIALKVSTLSLTEKTIGFQDFEFQSRANELTAKIDEHYEYLKNNGNTENAVEALMKSKEYLAARDFFTNYLYWREGKYRFEMHLQEVRGKSPHIEVFELSFTKTEVEQLRANCQELEPYIRALIASNEGGNDAVKFPSWNWVTLQVSRVSKN